MPLREMTEADRAALAALGIRVIVDLGTDLERAQHPYTWNGSLVRAPLVTEDLVRSVHARFAAGTITDAELEDWWTPAGVFRRRRSMPNRSVSSSGPC